MLELNKIYCMDCLEGMKQIDDNSIDLVITDPPFNVSQRGKKISRKGMKMKQFRRDTSINLDFGEWDIFDSEQEYFTFTHNWFKECSRVLKEGSWIYIWFDKQRTGFFDLFLAKKYGIKAKTILVWHKTNPVPQFRKANYLSSSEFCWVGIKGKGKIKNFGYQKNMHNVIDFPNSSIYGKTKHPTEKPEKIISIFIKHNSNKGDLVLDPFMGSGTTAVAAKQLGRNFIGFEIRPEYCKIANKRLEQRVFSEDFSAEKSSEKTQLSLRERDKK